jgi:hypothetical protein
MIRRSPLCFLAYQKQSLVCALPCGYNSKLRRKQLQRVQEVNHERFDRTSADT